MDSFNSRELCKRVIKYILEGIVVAIAAILLPRSKPDFEAVIALAMIASATFAIVDTLMPSLNFPLKFGVGFGIGNSMVMG